jgi:hypothetical protein
VLFAANEALGPTDERLGSLLYSAKERSAIVRARKGSTWEETLTVKGIVKREHGKSTIWINNHPVLEGQPVPFVARTTISALSVTLDGQQVRVGETLDTTSHLRTDMVKPGAVSKKR